MRYRSIYLEKLAAAINVAKLQKAMESGKVNFDKLENVMNSSKIRRADKLSGSHIEGAISGLGENAKMGLGYSIDPSAHKTLDTHYNKAISGIERKTADELNAITEQNRFNHLSSAEREKLLASNSEEQAKNVIQGAKEGPKSAFTEEERASFLANRDSGGWGSGGGGGGGGPSPSPSPSESAKDVIKNAKGETDYTPYAVGAGVVGAGGLGAYLYNKKRKNDR